MSRRDLLKNALKQKKMSLKEAYRKTRYTIFNRPFVIEIGKHCQTLDEQLQKHAAVEWAYITAWNPYSNVLSQEENDSRHQLLMASVKDYPHWEGEGIGTDSNWQPERSLLVLGISRKEAISIGKHFEQNAIVYGRIGEPAELIELFDFE
jgi:Protein of unknown function (DUF3293)